MAVNILDRFVRRPDLARVVLRFPVAAAAFALLTLYLVLDLHLVEAWSIDARIVRIPAALLAAGLVAVATTLHSEATGHGGGMGQWLGLFGSGIVALLLWLANPLEVSPTLVLGALALSILVAPFLQRAPAAGGDNAAFWGHTLAVAVALLLALVVTVLFAGGLSIIVETLRFLLGLPIPARAHEKVWAIAACLVGPVYALSLLPQPGVHASEAAGGVAESDFAGRAIALIVRFVAVPLLLLYALILHLAALKALFDQALPSGRLGWMVLSFGTATAATALAAWPIRHTGGRLVRLFWTVWPWLLVVPLLLLWFALSARVGAYGWTGPRYLAALAGLWLASLVATQSILARSFDGVALKLVPGALCALLAVTALGPWGYAGFPFRSQVRELTARLEAGGVVKGSRLAIEPGAKSGLGAADRQHVGDIVSYLSREGRLYALRPLFDGVRDDPFRGAPAGKDRRQDLSLADRVRERLDLGRTAPARRFVGFQAGAPRALALPAATVIVGPVSLDAGDGKPARRELAGARPLTAELERDVIVITERAGGRSARFDIAALLADPAISEPQTVGQERAPHLVDRTAGNLPARILLTGLFARDDAGRMVVTSATLWLLLGP